MKNSRACEFHKPNLMPTSTSRYAQISRQLHPFKVKYWMRDKEIRLNMKMKCGFKHINRNLLSLQIQLSHCYASQHMECMLEWVINCIP